MAYQKDISAMLGLSVSTVSRALKGYPDISEETRKKVLRTAEELDYNYKREDANRPAPRLWGAVGLLAPGSADLVKSPYYREVLCGMTGEAAECLRDLVIMGEDCAEQEMSWIGRVIARKVDGICLLASKEDLYRGRFSEILGSSVPLVSVENEVAGFTSICRDFRKNAALIMKYLKEMGHRRTAFPGDQSIEYRKNALVLREEAQKLDMDCLEMDFGELEAKVIADLTPMTGVTCVIFSSRREARAWIDKWKRCGVKVPEDLSAVVLQTDNEEWNCRGDDMTCVSNMPAELGREAVRRVVSILEHPEKDRGEIVYIVGRLIPGSTVADMSGNSPENI